MSATAVRTRLWVDGEVKTENFPLSDVSEYLNQPGALVWADLCNPDERLLSELADEMGAAPATAVRRRVSLAYLVKLHR